MKLHALVIAILLAATNTAQAADSRIEKLCGMNHRNELVSVDDATGRELRD